MPEVIGKCPRKSKETTCNNCGSIIRYYPADVRVISKGKDISGCYGESQGFNCPSCSKIIYTEVT